MTAVRVNRTVDLWVVKTKQCAKMLRMFYRAVENCIILSVSSLHVTSLTLHLFILCITNLETLLVQLVTNSLGGRCLLESKTELDEILSVRCSHCPIKMSKMTNRTIFGCCGQ